MRTENIKIRQDTPKITRKDTVTPGNGQRPYEGHKKGEGKHIPGQFGQLGEDRLHVENLAGDEETDSNGGKVDNPRCHLKNSSKFFGIIIFFSDT